MKIAFRFFTLVCILLASAALAMGQVATGNYTYGSYDNLGFDTINVGNLNLHASLPVLNKPGRGMPFTYALSYDSSIWTPVTVNGSQQWQPSLNWGWAGVSQITTGYL